MKRILESYFEMIDREAFFALQIIAILPLALLVGFLTWLRDLTKEVRERAGRRAIAATLWLFPRRSVVREHAVGLLNERRGYERYQGWCQFAGTSPLSFGEWRAENVRFAWLKKKMLWVA